MKTFTKKPWGSETLIEFNKFYVLKKLKMKKNHQCSLQFHRKKKETIFILSGLLQISYGKKIKNLKKKIIGQVNPSLLILKLFIG